MSKCQMEISSKSMKILSSEKFGDRGRYISVQTLWLFNRFNLHKKNNAIILFTHKSISIKYFRIQFIDTNIHEFFQYGYKFLTFGFKSNLLLMNYLR